MVPIAQRLKIGAVLGYLIAGIVIGPWGLGLFKDVDDILHFSELGVVFLMFLIGLELNPAKLWELRRYIWCGFHAGSFHRFYFFRTYSRFNLFFMASGGYWWIGYCNVFNGYGTTAYE